MKHIYHLSGSLYLWFTKPLNSLGSTCIQYICYSGIQKYLTLLKNKKKSGLPQVCIHFWDDPAAILRKVHNFNKLREKLPQFKLEEMFMHKL